MNPKAQSPAVDLPWIAVPLAMVGLYLLWEGISRDITFSTIHGSIILAVGIAVWFEQSWGRLAGSAYFASIAAAKVYEQSSNEFTFPQMLAVGGCGSLAWALWYWRENSGKGKRPLVSLVLLLRQGRFLSDRTIARAASKAWGAEFAAGEDHRKGNFVAGETPLFTIRCGGSSYLVHNQNQTYFSPRDRARLTEITEPSLRAAVAGHEAWIAVDLLEMGKQYKKTIEAYPQISRLLAELTGPDCLAVLCPETGLICTFDDTTDEKLRSSDPLGELGKAEPALVLAAGEVDPRPSGGSN